MLSLLFAFVVAATAPDPDTSTLTAIVADVAGRVDGVSVVTRSDVSQLLEMEASQQQLGCDETSATCIAEVAAALGAEIVVRAELGMIDDERSLSLSVINSGDLTATARSVVRGRSIGALGDEVARVLPDLVRKVKMTTKTTATSSTRVFVTDVARTDGRTMTTTTTTEAPPAAASGGLGWLLPVGVVGVVLGGIGVTAAVFSEVQVSDALATLQASDTTPKQALTAKDTLDQHTTQARIAWIVGGSLVVVGGTLIVVGMSE